MGSFIWLESSAMNGDLEPKLLTVYVQVLSKPIYLSGVSNCENVEVIRLENKQYLQG